PRRRAAHVGTTSHAGTGRDSLTKIRWSNNRRNTRLSDGRVSADAKVYNAKPSGRVQAHRRGKLRGSDAGTSHCKRRGAMEWEADLQHRTAEGLQLRIKVESFKLLQVRRL